jgi:hypothetical protein
MKINPALIEQAKADIQKLKDLSVLSYPIESRANSDEFPITLGFKLSPKQDKWLADQAKIYTGGKRSSFLRTIIDSLMQLDKYKEEPHTNEKSTKFKRKP